MPSLVNEGLILLYVVRSAQNTNLAPNIILVLSTATALSCWTSPDSVASECPTQNDKVLKCI